MRPENKLRWPGTAPAAKAKASPDAGLRAKAGPAPAARPKGLPSNAMPQSEYTLEQLKKMAGARGLSVEKLLAQMVQQYLKEE